MLNVSLLSAIMLSVIMLSDIMLSVIMLSSIMLSVIMLNLIMNVSWNPFMHNKQLKSSALLTQATAANLDHQNLNIFFQNLLIKNLYCHHQFL
jgi:hypothetical protein